MMAETLEQAFWFAVTAWGWIVLAVMAFHFIGDEFGGEATS